MKAIARSPQGATALPLALPSRHQGPAAFQRVQWPMHCVYSVLAHRMSASSSCGLSCLAARCCRTTSSSESVMAAAMVRSCPDARLNSGKSGSRGPGVRRAVPPGARGAKRAQANVRASGRGVGIDRRVLHRGVAQLVATGPSLEPRRRSIAPSHPPNSAGSCPHYPGPACMSQQTAPPPAPSSPGWGLFVGGVLLGSTVAAGAAYLAVRYANNNSADELRRAASVRRRPPR